MSKQKTQNIIIALSGIFQAAGLIKDLAHTGNAETRYFESSIHSIFVTNPQNVSEVYGDMNQLRKGIDLMIKHLELENGKDPECLRYVINMLHLHKQLKKQKDMLTVIGKRIDETQHQINHFGEFHENVIAGLAAIYSDTISQLKPRIQVLGDPQYLKQSYVADKVRALCLAGIRSAMLWGQVGGSRWQILLGRKKLLEAAHKL